LWESVQLARELMMASVERLVARPAPRQLMGLESSERQAAWEEQASPV